MNDPLIGRVLGDRYRVEHPIGAGGMGAVYVAVQIHLGRRVALKTLLDATDPRDAERLRTEATAAAALAHPNIVHVTDFLPARGDEPPCIVMELLAGRSLARVMRERGPLPVPMALHIARQMLGALAAAHAAGIVHRDVKPANVVVLDGVDRDAPSIKMVDFGIAKLMNDDSRHTTTGTILGTPHYMAPEQHLALPPTPAVDVWAVGVCLYEMLAGRRPFAGSIDEVFTAITRGRAPDLANVPREIADVVALALVRDPNVRYPDAAAMLAALTAVPDAAVPAASPSPASSRPPSRVRIFLAAMTFAIVAASLAALALVRLPAKSPSPPPVTVTPPNAEPTTDVVDASAEVDAEVDEPPAASASSAPAKPASPRGVPCLCLDGWTPVCAEPMLQCECRASGPGMICFEEWPDGDCYGALHSRPSKTDRTGEPCRGWRRIGAFNQERNEPAEGTLACGNACSTSYARNHPTIAVPGTPCRGFAGLESRAGKWVKIVPPPGR